MTDPNLPYSPALSATQPSQKRKSVEKISAITTAIVVHVVIGVIAALTIVATNRPKPPQFDVSMASNLDEAPIEQETFQKQTRSVTQASAAASEANVMSVDAMSSFSLPEIDVDVSSFDPVGMTGDIGMSMQLGSGEAGDTVAFFGSASSAKRVVFVVDYSKSMESKGKAALMRKELAKSIEALPPSIEYQLVFFSGPAWYGHQRELQPNARGKKEAFVKDGKDIVKWTRAGEAGALPVGGWDALPKADYIKASKSNITKSLKDVKESPLSFGTQWGPPLKMAMNMKPDTIYFMTDGGGSNDRLVKELLAYNKKQSNATINTICMMILNARKNLEELANKTGGEFTLVQGDGTVVRGRDLDKL